MHGFWDQYNDWWEQHRVLKQPEPLEFKYFSGGPKASEKQAIDLRSDYKESGLQIIFKLANIHLTPENPEYNSSNWHVEGALNEHICATAIYYYDSENIGPSHLAFRQSIDSEDMIMRPEQVSIRFSIHLPHASTHSSSAERVFLDMCILRYRK